MLPRKKWTRTDVPLFHKNPNHCAIIFNEELHGIVGSNRVIRVFNQFSSSGRGDGQKDSLPTICKKFYRRDGLHPNEIGSQLLGALISQSVFNALKKVKSTPLNPQRFPVCGEDEPKANGSAFSEDHRTHSQSKSALPRMIYRETYVPPPPMEDPHHYPHLSPLVDEVETNSRPEDVSSFPLVLSGYSEAVKREVIVSTALPAQQPLHRVRPTRTCK